MKIFNKYNLSLFFLILGMVTSNIGFSQNRLQSVELNTQRSIRKLIEKINNFEMKDTNLIDGLSQLSKSSTFLFDKVNNDNNFNQLNDTLFINTLEQSQKSLSQLLTDWRSNKFAKDLIQAIKIDYDIKIASSPLGALSQVNKIIEVSVITKSGNNYVNGYDVKCNYMWDSDLVVGKIIFNNQTNNAIRNLAPGYYVIWIEKNGIEIQRKNKVEIGNSMQLKETIIFNL